MGSHALHPFIAGTKTRITALHQHGKRKEFADDQRELTTSGEQLYAGCADGSLRVYSLAETEDDSPKLLETHQIGRRQIDQVGVLPEAKQLVVLTGELGTSSSPADSRLNRDASQAKQRDGEGMHDDTISS